MFLVLALTAALHQVPAPTPAQIDQQNTCLTCHGDQAMSIDLPSGEKRSLFVSLETVSASVHGRKLTCIDCHADMQEIPHPERSFKSVRDFTIAYYEQCKRCHFANYTKTLDSVHYSALARGDRTAPVCVDCHGAHNIQRAAQSRSAIVDTCGRCHAGVSATYRKSVHGRVLGTPAESDVPLCNDCHRTHDVAGPRQADWRMKTPQLCGTCHANESLMRKYNLSTAVLKTYVSDFHGKTASLRSSESGGAAAGKFVALCTDCHGVHDIVKVDEAGSKVVAANLQKTCASCHPNASPQFSAAWLSHYEPSLKKAPLVYLTRMFYLAFIPFIIGGLGLQVLLHLWRVVVNR